jgi:short-subunit dehydrogenase
MDYDKIKKVWIVGASSGIGEALAKRLADEGKNVFISARSEDKLKQIAKYSDRITPIKVDVTNTQSIAGAMETIGDFDSLVHCAAAYEPNAMQEFSSEDFNNHFKVNVEGTGNILDPVLKRFKEKGHGHIAIIASVAGYHGLPKSVYYGPTKAALNNLCEALAIEFYDTDIKIQVINPGFVKTPLTDKNDFEMPMMITPEKAADYIVKGLKRGWYEITFPWTFSLALKAITKLPKFISLWLIRKGTKGKIR